MAKIRNGFVSNSSSSSFILGKYFLTNDQIELIENNLKEINEANSGEGYLFNTKYYFQGEISHHNDKLDDLIKGMAIEKFCSFEC